VRSKTRRDRRVLAREFFCSRTNLCTIRGSNSKILQESRLTTQALPALTGVRLVICYLSIRSKYQHNAHGNKEPRCPHVMLHNEPWSESPGEYSIPTPIMNHV
jgi:hypothetical protein